MTASDAPARLSIVLLCVGVAGTAMAQEPLLDLRSGVERVDLRQHSSHGPTEYLTQGGWWITAIGGASLSGGSTTDAFAGVQATKFVIDRFEAGFEVAGWGMAQDGTDTAGGSASVVLRYHVWDRGWGTIFADAGLGLLATNDVTPRRGTSVNFLPRLGGGVSIRAGERSRVLLGARWHHISNGRVLGNDNNPARDEVMLFAGWQWAL